MRPGQIGRYEVQEPLGRGGMATVYRAHDPVVGREVALKLIAPAIANDPMFRARFEREVKTIAMLEHVSIVPVYDVGEENGQLYLVMRLMTGGTLDDVLGKGPMPLGEIKKLFQQIGSAIDAAHRRGIVHRDLKPANILFDDLGNAFLSDFGIVKLAEETSVDLTGSVLLGTAAYMSPEQIKKNNRVDHRSDVYALGIMLFHTLTGRVPFDGEYALQILQKHIMDPVPNPRQLNPNVPAGCEAVIFKSLAKEADERFSSVLDMVSAVQRIGQQGDTAVIDRIELLTEQKGVDTPPYWKWRGGLLPIPLRSPQPDLPDAVVRIPVPRALPERPPTPSKLSPKAFTHRAELEKYEEVVARETAVYAQELAAIQQQLDDYTTLQRNLLEQANPSLANLSDFVARRTFWQRRPTDSDFLVARVGRGSRPNAVRIEAPANISGDPRLAQANLLAQQYSLVQKVPLTVNLRQTNSVVIYAHEEESGVQLAYALLAHIATHHTPADVPIFILSQHPEAAQRWGILKWLPHTQALEHGGQRTHMALSAESVSALLPRLTNLLQRPGRRDRPHYLLVFDHVTDQQSGAIMTMLQTRSETTVSAIFLGQPILAQPRLSLFLEMTGSLSQTITDNSVLPEWHTGKAEMLSRASLEKLARQMSGFQIVQPGETETFNLPVNVSLLDLYEVHQAEDIDLSQRYQAERSMSQGITWVIGLDKHHKPLSLSIGQPPANNSHILVVGAQGAGKSVFLQSTALSLAATYSPIEVNLLLACFGSDDSRLAELEQLPHTSLCLVQPTEEQTRQFCATLTDELNRRKALLETMTKRLQQTIPDFSTYNRLLPEAPLAKLVVLLDDVRRGLDLHPGLQETLEWARDTGRNLGVYLVLGAGRATDLNGMWRTGQGRVVSLRLTQREESIALLDSPVAAQIPANQPGRGYLRSAAHGLLSFQTAQANRPKQATLAHEGDELPFVIQQVLADGRRQLLYQQDVDAPRTSSALTEGKALIEHIRSFCAKTGYAAPSRQ